ncbi:MAG: LamG-like jellyroll fold domain-containing protein [Patescibacteria group bacterium]
MITKNKKNNNSGFVMLFAIILSSIILTITLGVLNIALKEMNFSSSAKETGEASFAADTGVECALYYDKLSTPRFAFPDPGGSITCATDTTTPVLSGNATIWSYDFVINNLGSSSQGCVKVNVEKDATDPLAIITDIVSKGYNVGNSVCDSSNSNRIEREYEVLIGAVPTAPPPPTNYTLTVSTSGTGSGTVTSAPIGISCGADCTEDYSDGTVVTLSAAAGGGSTFTSWSGEGCSGTGTCVVTMSAIRNVTATFDLTFPPNLRASYDFSNNANDSSGNGLNGTLSGSPVFTAGHKGNAIVFDGINDYISMGSPALLDDVEPMSITFWINPDQGSGYIISKRDTTGCTGFWRLGYGTGPLNLQLLNAKGIAGSSTGTFAVGSWTHVAFTWDGGILSSGTKIYINGVEGTAYGAAGVASRLDASCSMYVGARQGAPFTEFFKGKLDELHIYNRALTPAEVTQDMGL